ncbi:gamma-glutamylcyclotransferase family protein [Deinococcus sp.]|uniref:gamma-glutamylcyclotransferase family protein n=1 Tax=Deinococcus sp. TaxID=47478 RepID=UPI003B591D64
MRATDESALGQSALGLPRVFVYGTLMPGERWETVARQGGTYDAQPATLHGAVLADLRPEGYPALFEARQFEATQFEAANSASEVHGWLYSYTAESWPRALPFLDELEGVQLSPPLYRRSEVMVQTGSAEVQAWAYFYARPARRNAPGFEIIASGRWAEMQGRHLEGPRQTWDDQGGT